MNTLVKLGLLISTRTLDTKKSGKPMFCDNNDSCEHQPSQHNQGTSRIKSQELTIDAQNVAPLTSSTK